MVPVRWLYRPVKRWSSAQTGFVVPAIVRDQVRPLVLKQLAAKAASDQLATAECKKLLTLIKRRCPGLLPPKLWVAN